MYLYTKLHLDVFKYRQIFDILLDMEGVVLLILYDENYWMVISIPVLCYMRSNK
jgi:hypothetical protein